MKEGGKQARKKEEEGRRTGSATDNSRESPLILSFIIPGASYYSLHNVPRRHLAEILPLKILLRYRQYNYRSHQLFMT